MNENETTNTNAAEAPEPKTFDIIDGNTLLTKEYEPLGFAVDRILPHGLFLFAGSGKIGKSWLSLDMCVNVATGGKLWDFPSEQGDVLYLALEDHYRRLQDRLNKIQADSVDISRLKLTTAAHGISSGLLEQTFNHLEQYPDTKLIVIDTLERVRDTEYSKSIYACDYRDMTTLRGITDRHKLALVLIHHTRKLFDPDPLNTLSGSTGLVGSVDGVFVLEKEKRVGLDAKLTIANRDTEDFCFRLRFDPDHCKWDFVCDCRQAEESADEKDEKDEWLVLLVDELVKESWSGTATELCDALKKLDPGADLAPRTITKRLKSNTGAFKDAGIEIAVDRNRNSRAITITRKKNPQDEQEQTILPA